MSSRSALARFFRTPKGLLTIILAVLAAAAVFGDGIRLLMPLVLASVAAAAIVDLVILRIRKGQWEFPSGAVLTGLIVAMVLRPQEPWYVGACTCGVAVASRYVFRTRMANIFNPAALALVAMFYVFHSGQSWWGGLPELPSAAIVLLLGSGIFIAERVNKLPMVLAFLGGYYLLFTITAFAGDPGHVAEIFRAPDLHASLYFAFFILTDPPTSPTKARDQIVCGVIVAVVSYAVFEWVGAAYYLLAGVLVGNVWETWRRWRMKRGRVKAAGGRAGERHRVQVEA